MNQALERNLRLVTLHEILTSTAPWAVVLVLFTRARFDLDGALALSGIYYLCVVLFEVPSGWASDRFGRVRTLRFVGIAWMVAFGCWTVADDRFWMVALGQALVAAGYASLSGTDVSFHYDTLEALGRAGQFADRQASLVSRGRVVGALGAIAGGALGLIDLRLAFVASFLLAMTQFTVTFGFTDPAHTQHAQSEAAGAIWTQVRRCLGYLTDIPLRWVFGYGVAMVVLEHVAFSLFAPWVTETLGKAADDLESTPFVVGCFMAIIGLVGAAAARLSTPVARRWGVRTTLVGLGALSAVIVTAMALAQHPAVLALVMLRSVQGAAAPILISAAVAPAVAQHHRATLLSLNSLGGRLVWGSILLGLSTDATSDVAPVLFRFSSISWVLVVATLATAVVVHRRHGPVLI
ncbi:MAG: MFS family permease [Acidimicrobiales bacterium]|jgi:MFS family permease